MNVSGFLKFSLHVSEFWLGSCNACPRACMNFPMCSWEKPAGCDEVCPACGGGALGTVAGPLRIDGAAGRHPSRPLNTALSRVQNLSGIYSESTKFRRFTKDFHRFSLDFLGYLGFSQVFLRFLLVFLHPPPPTPAHGICAESIRNLSGIYPVP